MEYASTGSVFQQPAAIYLDAGTSDILRLVGR